MITILTERQAYVLESAADWGRDMDGDVHVYDRTDTNGETLATFDADRFVAALQAVPDDRQRDLAEQHTAAQRPARSTPDEDDDHDD